MTTQNELRCYTSIPRTLQAQKLKAQGYIKQFQEKAQFIAGEKNPYLLWLEQKEDIDREFFFDFINWWWWLSRFQPQTLWKLMSKFPDREDQAQIFDNAQEESGLRKRTHQPHWQHLQRLVEKLGGELRPSGESEVLLLEFMGLLDSASEAQSIGYLAAIEYPGCTISDFFVTLVSKIGRADLVRSDFYTNVHTTVESGHIIKAVGSMLQWMHDKEKQERKGYDPKTVEEAFVRGMQWWEKFWKLGFQGLGFR